MNFWDYIKRVRDNEPCPYSIVANYFDFPETAGRTTITAKLKKAAVTGRDLISLKEEKHQFSNLHRLIAHTAKVYWLPYIHGNITAVFFNDLNSSQCDYFMTSEFTGCRFVVTNEYVAHVSAWPYASPKELGISHPTPPEASQARTRRETEFRTVHNLSNPSLHRVLSSMNITDSQSSNFGSPNHQIFSYHQDGKNSSAFVFGYRNPASPVGWSFKYIAGGSWRVIL